jgi:hypothetical protein
LTLLDVRPLACGVRSFCVAFGAACCSAGCGGEARQADLAAPIAFEHNVSTLCGFEPSDDPLGQGLRTALENGQATFDRDAAARCIDWLDENGCPHANGGALAFFVLRLPGICRLAYTGHVGVGDSCAISAACLGDAYCHAHTETSSTCEPRSLPSATCHSIDECSVYITQVPNCVRDEAETMRCVAEP